MFWKTWLKTNTQGCSTQLGRLGISWNNCEDANSSFVKKHKRRPRRYSPSLTDTSRWCRIKKECDGLNADWLCLLVFCLPLLLISVSALNKGKEVNSCADLNVHTYKQQMLCMKRIPQCHARISFLQQWILQCLCKTVFICCTCLCWCQTKRSAAKISQDILLSFTLQSQIPAPLWNPPCKTSTPRYQFYVITRLLSFWHIGPSWSFAICSSYLCLLWLNVLQASIAPGKRWEKLGC